MKVTEVRIKIYNKRADSRVLAEADITIDEALVIHHTKLIETQDGTNFIVAMPSKKTSDGTYKDVVHPIDSKVREEITNAVVSQYMASKAEAEAANATKSEEEDSVEESSDETTAE